MINLDYALAQWSSIPRDGLVPRLSDYLDRADIAIQPWTLIVDMNEKTMPVRLCGTGMVELLGCDFTGRNYLQAVKPEIRQYVIARDRLCVTHPCGLKLTLTASTAGGRMFDDQVLVLPLKRAGGHHSLLRHSAVHPSQDYRDVPISILSYQASTWIDLGDGVPGEAPWADPALRCDETQR